jgi:YVTN family beta-propeller protein
MSRLGDPEPVVLGGAPYAVTAVLGALLREVVDKVTATQGDTPDHIVLTRPASWGPFRCALFEEAARQAGLTKPAMVTEPEAAAAHYGATQGWHDGDTIAVYDLGWGTFNAAVVRNRSGEVQILGKPERIERLGDWGDWADGEADRQGVPECTITALSRTLQSAQVEPADLSAVLLVGGSSGLPSAAQMVSAQLGRPTVVDPQPQHVVALGAATLAAQSAHLYRPARQAKAAGPSHASTEPDAAPPIPEQRTAPATEPSGSAASRTVVTVQAPVAGTRPPVAPSRPPIQSPLPASKQVRPDSERPNSRGYRARVLAGSGAAVALAGGIAVALVAGNSGAKAPTLHSAPPPPKAQPTAVAKVGSAPATPTGATIPVQATPGFVAVSPDGRYAYTANRDARVITVVDTAANQVTATIPIAAGPPRFLSFAPDGRTLYISVFNDQQTAQAIDVLDTRSNTVVATIPQPARPYLPEVSPNGKQLYVPHPDIASVSVIDTATNTVAGDIPVAPSPSGVAFSSDGQLAFAANHESNLVSVIETRNLEVEKTIPVRSSPRSIAINPHRPLAGVVNDDANSVSMIDTAGQQVMATIPVGKDPQDVAWSPDGRFAYVVNKGSNSVSVIDSETNQVTATLPTGAGPTSIALLPGGRRAYVSNVDGASLTVLQLTG